MAKGMIQWLRNFFKKPTRAERVLAKCGCICRCPDCNDILNDQAEASEVGDLVQYICGCGRMSQWYFDAPVPVLWHAQREES